MMLTEDKEVGQHGYSVQPEVRFSKGEFVAVVQADENQYKFHVRDLRGEGPTIYGCGVDLPHAVTAVTRLMNALTHRT